VRSEGPTHCAGDIVKEQISGGGDAKKVPILGGAALSALRQQLSDQPGLQPPRYLHHLYSANASGKGQQSEELRPSPERGGII
jgi:hypothetical protein